MTTPNQTKARPWSERPIPLHGEQIDLEDAIAAAPAYRDELVTLYLGDCLEVLRALTGASVDAIVTDPPAGIEFMGKEWDTFKSGRLKNYAAPPGGTVKPKDAESDKSFKRLGSLPHIRQQANRRCGKCSLYAWSTTPCKCETPEWEIDTSARATFVAFMTAVMVECFRVLKPGGHALVWAIPRTSHWTATAVEDAGFEVRDVITHHFGSGFPKSLDVSKAIDKLAGATHEVVSERVSERSARGSWTEGIKGGMFKAGEHVVQETAPATDAAAEWQGWGTALKPASEHWILARRPLSEANIAANVLKHGTGALNIDGCRIGDEARHNPSKGSDGNTYSTYGPPGAGTEAIGRWPANLALSHSDACANVCADDCPVAGLDRQADAGGASRFFYTAKASPSELNAGLEGMPAQTLGTYGGVEDDMPKDMKIVRPRANVHPTVKSTDLMRWLCRLITPKRGLVLDPFMGSGSTGVAAKLEDFRFVGIEREEEYMEIAKRRLGWAVSEPELFDLDVVA